MALRLGGFGTRGGGASYQSLFRAGNGEPSRFAKASLNWDGDSRISDFGRRFGFARAYERNTNLIKVLEKPVDSLKDVNNSIFNINVEKSGRYQNYLSDLRTLGFSDAEATQRADIMIGREIENDLFLLQESQPFAIGGAAAGGWDPVNTILRQDKSIAGLPTTTKAIAGLQAGAGPKRISKKQKLKRRIRKRYGA